MIAKVKEALDHVRQHHPEVVQVFYGVGGQWLYFDEHMEAPKFSPLINVSLLEDAADAVKDLPAAFAVTDELVP